MEKSIYARDYAVFCSLLRSCREKAGLSQQAIAERLHETQTFVSKCERGERRVDIVELSQWCTALGISLNVFVRLYEDACSKTIGR